MNAVSKERTNYGRTFEPEKSRVALFSLSFLSIIRYTDKHYFSLFSELEEGFHCHCFTPQDGD